MRDKKRKLTIYIIASCAIAFPIIAIGQAVGVVDESSTLTDVITYTTKFLIFAGIFIATFSLVRGGFLWMTSSGDPLKIKDAREKISAAVLGLVIVLGATVFLSSINPKLTVIDEDDLKDRVDRTTTMEVHPPGFYLTNIPIDQLRSIPMKDLSDMVHDEEGEFTVQRIMDTQRNLQGKGDGIKSIRIVNQVDRNGDLTGFYYVLVLHEQVGFRGRCQILFNTTNEPQDFAVDGGSFASITAIQVAQNPPLDKNTESILGGIDLYERPDFNGDKDGLTITTIDQDHTLSPLSSTREKVWSMNILRVGLNQQAISKLDGEGNIGLVLASGDSWDSTSNGCGVFLNTRSIPDLKMHHMNRCDEITEAPFFSVNKSCSTHYLALPLYRNIIIFDYIEESE